MKYFLIVTLFFCCSSFANFDPKYEEVSVACLKANPVMYFVPASKPLSKKIITQLKSSISSGSLKCEESNNWVCTEKEFGVFQGYDGKGKKADFALVCES